MTRRRATIAYLVVLAAIAAWLIAGRGPAMAELFDQARPWPLLGLVAASILPFLANTAFWTLALRELGETVTWQQVNEAATETTLTRYLPGGIWLAAGRGVALARRGVGTPALVAMVGLEVAWLGWLAAGLLVGATTLGRPALNGALAWWARRRHQPPPAALTTAGVGRLALALAAYWAIFGSVFWAYLEVMDRSAGWLAATGGFALSWRIGLFTVVAPQGLGVFEPAFVALIGWGADALLLVGAFRVVLVARDLALTALAALVARRRLA